MEVVCVPAHLALPWSPQAKQLCHLHAQPSLGQNCDRQKTPCIYECRVTLVVSNSLQQGGLWPARFLCQWGSPGKNTGVYWPILVAIPFQRTIFPAALATNYPEYLVLQEPLRPKQLHHLHIWSSQEQTQVLQSSFRSKPRWTTHIQRWK